MTGGKVEGICRGEKYLRQHVVAQMSSKQNFLDVIWFANWQGILADLRKKKTSSETIVFDI